MERHVLVVLPHPDDESFGCAGTIAKFRQTGVPVTYVCGTLGEMGRNMGRPFFANRETLRDVRKEELLDACRVLDITELRMMGLRDKTIEFEDRDALANRIEQVLLELMPSLVITHYPGHGVHPDHDALGAATVLAVSRVEADVRPRVHAMAITKNRVEALGNPNVLVDISDVADIKLAAIKAHRSQAEGILSQLQSRITEDPNFKNAMDHILKQELFWTYTFAN